MTAQQPDPPAVPHARLSVLDLLPRASGDDQPTALAHAVDLARAAERAGYGRLWYAEHHLNPGVLGASPAVVIALVGGATSTIRLGSAGVQLGHRTPLATVEEFGLLDAAFPGRIDLGIGRSPSRPAPEEGGSDHGADGADGGSRGAVTSFLAARTAAAASTHAEDTHAPNGLLVPAQFDPSAGGGGARLGDTIDLLQQPGAHAPDYDEQIGLVQTLLRGEHTGADGRELPAVPGRGADLQLWVLGASAGRSAAVAGARGLPFVASYHHSPSTVLDAVEAYRAAFVPSPTLAEPYVAVSVDAVAAPTADEARRLAAGYAHWVRSIRAGEGAIPYPSDDEVAALPWTDTDAALVHDRVRTQLVGDPGEVADRLAQVAGATGAAELAITTITHDHAARVRSYELIAEEWARRG